MNERGPARPRRNRNAHLGDFNMSTLPQSKTTAKARMKKEFLVADPEDFSPELRHLLAQQREIDDARRIKKAGNP